MTSEKLQVKVLLIGNEHCEKSVQIRSFSGLYFPVFSPNTGKYGPEKTPYLDTFHAVQIPLIRKNVKKTHRRRLRQSH